MYDFNLIKCTILKKIMFSTKGRNIFYHCQFGFAKTHMKARTYTQAHTHIHNRICMDILIYKYRCI